MTAYSEASTLIPCVPAGGKPPPLKWWGNIFRRVWADRSQLVIVIRLPWWSWRVVVLDSWMNMDGQNVNGYAYTTSRYQQLMISWRQGEGWQSGWRPA